MPFVREIRRAVHLTKTLSLGWSPLQAKATGDEPHLTSHNANPTTSVLSLRFFVPYNDSREALVIQRFCPRQLPFSPRQVTIQQDLSVLRLMRPNMDYPTTPLCLFPMSSKRFPERNDLIGQYEGMIGIQRLRCAGSYPSLQVLHDAAQ